VSLATFTGRAERVPAAKISAQDEATIRARHAAGEPLRRIARDYPISHQALSKRLKRTRERAGPAARPSTPARGRAPRASHGPPPEPSQAAGPSPAAVALPVAVEDGVDDLRQALADLDLDEGDAKRVGLEAWGAEGRR
jgi:hypothetical protein